MRRLSILAAALMITFGATYCNKPQEQTVPQEQTGSDDPSATPSDEPSQAPEEEYVRFSVDVTEIEIPAHGGSGEIPFTLETNRDDISVNATTEAGFILDLTVGESIVTFRAGENNSCTESIGTINISCTGVSKVWEVSVVQPGTGYPAEPSEEPEGPVADLLDIEFLPNGTAVNNAVGHPLKLTSVLGSGLSTYYNETYGRYVAHFNHTVATGFNDGYYKADYAQDATAKAIMGKGITMEALVRLDVMAPSGAETKFFSSHQGGGVGFLISTSGQGNCLTWLPNVSTTGSSQWIWTKTGVTPVPGRYYHLVGKWDIETGISRVYLDGELKATVYTDGKLNFPSSSSCWWFCIGGDPNSASTAESAWNGDIAIARIYGRALEEEEILGLWEEVKTEQPEDPLLLSDIRYMSPCSIRPGYKFLVYAGGLKTGDTITLSDGDKTYTPDTEILDGYAKVKVDATIPSGTYSMICRRGESVYPLGSIQLNISADAQNDITTKVVAHRGFHDGASGKVRPENSIAALKAAQDLGVYGSEFDVWMTTDGDLFINHDGTLGGVKIQDATTQTVAALKLSNGENIPTLEQYLEQGLKSDKTRMVLEIKTHSTTQRNNDVTDKCIALVKEKNLVDRVDWIAFDYGICKRIHAALPESMVEYLSGGKTPSALYADGIMGLDYSSLQQSWVKEAHDLGMIVNVWTIDSPDAMLKYMSWGVDYITTNKPDVCQELCDIVWITE
ncbi:MAG: hypothetical protein IJ795_05435 [Bacteroidales bacterium]|nr:hypothetical protein [Bacteroidales bacterium]